MLLVTLVVVLAATTKGETSSRDTIRFDGNQHTVYWCGHRLASPIFIQARDNVIHLNGIPGISPPPRKRDEARLAAKLDTIPYIRRFVRSGMSYSSALVAGYDAALVNFAAIARAYNTHASHGHATALAHARAAVDTSLLRRDIEVAPPSIDGYLRGFGSILYDMRAIDALRKTAGAGPIDIGPLVRQLRSSLSSRSPVIVSANEGGVVTLNDAESVRVRLMKFHRDPSAPFDATGIPLPTRDMQDIISVARSQGKRQ